MKTVVCSAGGETLVIADPRPLEEQVADRLGQLADLRWRKTQTFLFNGLLTPADPAISALTGAFIGLQMEGGEGTVNWKMDATTFVLLDLTGLTVLGLAIRAHIQGCFDREAALVAQLIAAENAEALDAVDIETGWPE